MTDTSPVLDHLAADFEPLAENRFRLFGQIRSAPAPVDGAARGDGQGGLSAAAADLLADALYAECHCVMPASSAARSRQGSHHIGAREYVRQLSAANCGSGSWQPGWRVSRVAADAITAIHLDVAFRVPAGQWRGDATVTREGDLVSVRIPKEYRSLLPGFYMATGDADDDMDWGRVVRIYWHVGARAAVDLVRRLTADLNDRRIAFHLKVPSDPRNFGRSDALVVYLRSERYAEAHAALLAASDAFRAQLDPRVSPFAKRLAPGVCAAEDPGGGQSYGRHRSRLLADALASPPSMRARSPEARARVLRDHLTGLGFDPRALYLNPGATDLYPPFGP